MDSARWEQIQALFHDALDRPENERRTFLELACGNDAELMAEVLAMLRADSRSRSLLDRGLPEVAYQLVGGPLEPAAFREFGPYRLKRILGEGGMGVVWLAERADAGNLVAIKFLPHAGLSPARRERFAREIKTLAKLKHPFIARLYDAGTLADGTPWFVMEYVEGVRLTEYCRNLARSTVERLRLFRQVCEAVQYAHGQEIIHRDLKPSNILVEQDGTPRLLDFGIARELQLPGEPVEHTQSALRFLSPDYAAPEWVRDGTVGFYTDVYSLGVILYEIFAGEQPSQGTRDEPPVPRNDLDLLWLKAMRKDAPDRYQSVEALIRDIDHYLKGEPLDARPDTLRYRVGKFLTRNRRMVGAASLAALLIVGLVVYFTVRLAVARNTALAEAARTKRVERFMLNLFEGGDRETAPSSGLSVVTLLDRGARQAAALNSDPQTQAELYETLGGMYEVLGDFQKADGLLRAGLDKMKAAWGPENPKVADALAQLGTLRGDQAQYKDAERLVREGLNLATRHLPPDDPTVVETKATLGRVMAQSGSFESAIAILDPIVRLRPSGEDGNYTLSQSLAALAIAHYYAGHYAVAESLDRRLLVLDRQLFGELHPRTATDLMNLGSIKLTSGQYSEAEGFYQEAVEIAKAWYGPDNPDTATSVSLLARTLLAQGKYDEAQALLGHVLQVQERAYGKVHDRIAFTLDTLGRIAVKRGDLTAAQADFIRAVEIDRSLLGDTSNRTANTSVDLADAYLREGEYGRAERILREALKVLVATLPPGDPHIGSAQVKWGRALLHLKQYDAAEKQIASGCRILEKQPHPDLAQIHEARADLAAVHNALKQPGKEVARH